MYAACVLTRGSVGPGEDVRGLLDTTSEVEVRVVLTARIQQTLDLGMALPTPLQHHRHAHESVRGEDRETARRRYMMMHCENVVRIQVKMR